MKLRSILTIICSTFLVILLNIPLGKRPPLGKILSPCRGFWKNAATEKINLPQQLSLPGLQKPVTVRFDEYLIPHITAQNDADLHYAQGYVTALHRLWQMDFHTYVALGRLSEIFGTQTLEFDRSKCRKGNRYAAQNAKKQIEKDPTTRAMVQSYVDGVNAYIASLSYKDLPLEYKLLNYKPEPWTTLKVAATMVLMSDDLSGSDYTLIHTKAYHCLGKEKFDFLFPDYTRNCDPIIPKNTPWDFEPLACKVAPWAIPQPITSIKQPSRPKRASGSNNWAVHGKRTLSGAPILANDPHLLMHLPSIWYGVGLKSPTVQVFGASIPGIPEVIIGFNESIAWGVTNASWDVKDWYKIDFEDETQREYHYDNRLLKTQFVTEEIKVKGQESISETVVYTHLGPVVYEAIFQGETQPSGLGVKWAGHHPGKELLTLYHVNRAKNFKEFEAAMAHYDVPSHNFAFASTQNNIAMYIAGKLPAKWKEQGKFVMPGNNSAYDWQAFIPKEQNPKVLNPARGYVSSANQRATDKRYPYYYKHNNEEHYRNRTINQLLHKLKKVDEENMKKLQNDSYNLAAAESLPVLSQYIDVERLSDKEKALYQLLLDWDCHCRVNQLAPSIFKAWQEQLDSRLWKSLHQKIAPAFQPTFFRTVEILRDHPDSPYLDLGSYTTLQALIQDSFQSALQQLEAWQSEHNRPYRWGDYREVFIDHLAKIGPLGIKNVQVDGTAEAVNANEGGRGASMRIIVSLDKQPRGWFVYPGGQSGNPGSPYYANMIDMWQKSQYIPISLDLNGQKPDSYFTLMLQPPQS